VFPANRSTRGLQFTPEGRLFYDRSVRLLADKDELERSVAQAEIPSGKIRVSANVPVGRQLLLPIVPAFLEAHPKLFLEISLSDQVIDLLEQRTDVALRSGPLKSSMLIARGLGAARMLVVGSPRYFERYAVPKTPDSRSLLSPACRCGSRPRQGHTGSAQIVTFHGARSIDCLSTNDGATPSAPAP
jgi:DNA-binding transcriptional LysR family regulator